MAFKVGDTNTKPYTFDTAGIRAFALASGDDNPLHHDADFAAGSRFGGLIASGAQMAAVLMGFGASVVSNDQPSVGLEFSFRFARAIPADTPTELSWTITALEPHAKLGGTMVYFEGAITGAQGQRYVSATGKAVIWEAIAA